MWWRLWPWLPWWWAYESPCVCGCPRDARWGGVLLLPLPPLPPPMALLMGPTAMVGPGAAPAVMERIGAAMCGSETVPSRGVVSRSASLSRGCETRRGT